jgi:hypothetical protein
VQLDLSINLVGIGDLLLADGDRSAALESYREGLRVVGELADADPAHANAQCHLLTCYSQMGDASKAMAQDATRPPTERIESWREARAWYLREAEHVELLEQRNLLSPADAKLAEQRRDEIAHFDAAIAQLAAVTGPTTRPSIVHGDPTAGPDRAVLAAGKTRSPE